MTVHAVIPTTPRKFENLIGGAWSTSNGGEIVRNSPAHDVPVSIVPRGTKEDVERAVQAARKRFEGGGWSDMPAARRAAILRKAAELIIRDQEDLALVETLESGKPLWQARNEIVASAELWHYAAGQAQALHGESFNNFGNLSLGLVLREPIGVVGLITPWNFPFLILAERLPFILAAGCTTIVKPSEHTSGTALMMGRLLEEAGLPEGVLNIVTGYGDPVGQAIVEHSDIDMVSFTGSTRVGRSTVIASASNIKKISLELGGKNPVIVMADADLDKAADGIAFGVLHNAGQCCVSGSRLIVAESIREELIGRILSLIERVKVGDPLHPETKVGPIVNEAQMTRILGLVQKGREQGGKLLAGGDRTGSSNGYFIAPTIIGDVTQKMAISREEIFGPVLATTGFKTVQEALRLANDTEYGLSATIWTTDLQASMDLMRGVRAGRVWINTTITGGPEMPIGGYKQSGLGRETGLSGVAEYTEVKSVIVDLGERQPWVPSKA